MAHNFAQAGKCLQVVHNMKFDFFQPTGQTTYAYNAIADTAKSLTIKETGSLLIVESYTQGWMGNSGGGCCSTIRWTSGTEGGTLGRGSSSNGDGWSRSGDGGEANRSWSNGRIHCIDHGLTAGSIITIDLMFGAWSTTGATVNYTASYKSVMGWVATEFSRE